MLVSVFCVDMAGRWHRPPSMCLFPLLLSSSARPVPGVYAEGFHWFPETPPEARQLIISYAKLAILLPKGCKRAVLKTTEKMKHASFLCQGSLQKWKQTLANFWPQKKVSLAFTLLEDQWPTSFLDQLQESDPKRRLF